jgi:hypothetical protein
MNENTCAILISDNPGFLDRDAIESEIERQYTAGNKVFVYLLDEGVLYLHNEFWQSLESSHGIIYACGYGAKKHHVPFRDKVVFSGLATLAQLIKSSSTFISYQSNETESIYSH